MKLFNPFKFAPVTFLAAASTLSLTLAPAQAAIVTTGCASSTQCTLQELIDGGTIGIGDKLFSGWQAMDLGSTTPIDLTQIVVTPLDDNPLNPGLQYALNGQFTGSGASLGQGLGIGYNVSIVDGSNLRIKDTSLELLDSTVTGDGTVFVSESSQDSNGNTLGNGNTVGKSTTDELLFSENQFAPQSSIGVTTAASGTTDTVGTFALNTFEQRFSQTPIPEGSSVWSILLGAGAVGTGSIISNRLKSKRKKDN